MYNNLIEIPLELSEEYPDRVSHRFRVGNSFKDITYLEFVRDIRKLSIGFSLKGIKEIDHVSFFVNNRYEWIVTDFALQAIRAISIPRGSDTSPKEAEFIYTHSDSKFLILETTKELSSNINICRNAERIFIIEDGDIPEEFSGKISFYSELILLGEEKLTKEPDVFNEFLLKVKSDDVISIIYTSGTTGNPKGVVLTQDNFVKNVEMMIDRMEINKELGEVTVTILPSWHAFERTFEYCGLSRGVSFVYSSLRYFSADILREKPHIIPSVPRIWISIYEKMTEFMKTQPKLRKKLFYSMVNLNKRYKSRLYYLKKSYIRFDDENIFSRFFRVIGCIISIVFLFPLHLFAEKIFTSVRDKVGGRLRFALSGGGSLPLQIDEFFHSVGIQILNAYGMTECSPGIMSRTVSKNSLGTIGSPFPGTEAKILDEELLPVAKGQKGVLYIRGPQVMKEYYKNKKATEEILDNDGWLCTGDLAKETVYDEYVLVGRSKDTIVLIGGENVDPLPIEDKIHESDFVDHVMLLGQDKKGLTAFIALNQNALMEFAEGLKIKISDIFKPNAATNEPSKEYLELQKKVRDEIDKKISKEEGFKPFERITEIILVKNTFKIGKELTQTLKIKRDQIYDKYKSLISKFLKDDK